MFLAAFIDEIGNDNPKIIEKSHFFGVFFRYRFAMKITIFALAFLGLYQSLTGFNINEYGIFKFFSILFIHSI